MQLEPAAARLVHNQRVSSVLLAPTGNIKLLARDDLNNQIGTFCGVAAQQGVQDHDSGSIVRTYNQGQRYQVTLAMDWPSGQDITQNMKQNCIDGMTLIMDSKSPAII